MDYIGELNLRSSKPMRVLFVGVFEPPESSHHPMVRELLALGHHVDRFDFRRIEIENTPGGLWGALIDRRHVRKRSLPPPRFVTRLTQPGMVHMNRLLLEQVRQNDYDLVLLAKTELVDYRLLDAINKHCPTWYYFMDPMRVALQMHAKEFASRATYASASRSNVADLFRRVGGNAFFLTQGGDTEVFNPNPKVSKTTDVVFVGSNGNNRNAVLDCLKRNGIKVKTYGLRCDHPPVFGEALANVYRGAKIALNLNPDPANTGFSLRVFQVLASGTMLISQYCPDLERLFTRGQELEWFTSPEECVEMIKRYLADAEARNRIAAAGNALLNARFTWEQIMKRLCDEVQRDKKCAGHTGAPSFTQIDGLAGGQG